MTDSVLAQNREASVDADVEMSDLRLLEDDDDDDLMPFGQSNLTSVLANPDFGRRR